MEIQEYITEDNYEEQTKINHKVFKEYYNNWATTLGKWYSIVNYIDGFAGCRVYKDDMEKLHFGSPLIAADTLNRTPNIKKANVYLVESKKKVYNNLVHNIEIWKKKNTTHKINFHTFHGKFGATFINLKKQIMNNI